jgi:hypothetical protein
VPVRYITLSSLLLYYHSLPSADLCESPHSDLRSRRGHLLMNRSRIYGLYQALNLVSAFSSHHAPLVAIVVGVRVLTLWFSGRLIWSYLHCGADWIECSHRKPQMTGYPQHCAACGVDNILLCMRAKPLYLPKCISQYAVPLSLDVLAILQWACRLSPQTLIKSSPILTNMLTEVNLMDFSLPDFYTMVCKSILGCEFAHIFYLIFKE